MRNRLLIALTFIFLNWLPASFAAENTVDPREAAIDRAIGGMEEGSRPLLPQAYAGKNQAHAVPGGNLSPSSDTRVTASANAQGPSNSSTIGANNTIGSSTGTIGENTSGNINAGAGNTGANLEGSANLGAGSGGLQGGVQETVTGGTTGTTLEESANVGTQTGGSNEPATEPSGGGSSIVNVDANVDLSGGEPAVDANLTVDTNADNLLEADTSATTGAAAIDTSVTESGTVAGQDLTTAVNEAPVDATLDAEVGVTDIPAESEATAGLEADVDPVTADSDVSPTDPADGLSTTTPTL